MRDHLVRLSDMEMEQVKAAQEALVANGLGALPSGIALRCPECAGTMLITKNGETTVRCQTRACSYGKQSKPLISTGGAFALGLLAGLGAAVLVASLTKDKPAPPSGGAAP